MCFKDGIFSHSLVVDAATTKSPKKISSFLQNDLRALPSVPGYFGVKIRSIYISKYIVPNIKFTQISLYITVVDMVRKYYTLRALFITFIIYNLTWIRDYILYLIYPFFGFALSTVSFV